MWSGTRLVDGWDSAHARKRWCGAAIAAATETHHQQVAPSLINAVNVPIYDDMENEHEANGNNVPRILLHKYC